MERRFLPKGDPAQTGEVSRRTGVVLRELLNIALPMERMLSVCAEKNRARRVVVHFLPLWPNEQQGF